MDWKNYLIAVTLIGIIILAVAFAFVNGELTNLRSNLSTLQADATTLEMDINNMNATLYQLQLRIPKKNYASIPSEAFLPLTNTQTYDKGAGYLVGLGVFFATVQLPDKINITKMSALVTDASNTGYVYVSLSEHNLTRG
ncbi:MAG: hypothetical protein QXN95_03505, partial [Candidatus Bathyarchaeia archaeon]